MEAQSVGLSKFGSKNKLFMLFVNFGKVVPVNQVYHTSWEAVVTPTDRPKSVRNRCVIEHYCGVVCVFTLPF